MQVVRKLGLAVLMLVAVQGAGLWADDVAIVETPHAPDLPVKDWLVLHVPVKPTRNVQPLNAQSKLVPLDGFELTGPNPGHPFVLGDYRADGKWGVVEGGVQVIGGKSAALELARGDQFVLEGRMDQTNLGGWFLLVGWDSGHGYCLSNVVMKQSGAPWFLTEFRGGKALPETHVELPPFEWQREQAFKLQIENNELTLEVGPKTVIAKQPLENYQPGAIVLGTYDTRYGPRAVRLRTLRGRSLEPAAK